MFKIFSSDCAASSSDQQNVVAQDNSVNVRRKRVSLLCPITQSRMVEPVIAADGYTYEKATIQNWIDACRLRNHPITSPLTREPLANTILTPNLELKSLLESLSQFNDVPVEDLRELVTDFREEEHHHQNKP